MVGFAEVSNYEEESGFLCTKRERRYVEKWLFCAQRGRGRCVEK